MTTDNHARPSTPAVFLDRDGVLVRSIVRDGKPYAARNMDEFSLYPTAEAACRDLRRHGFTLVVVTNQPDVGNGLVEKTTVEEMNLVLGEALPVAAIKACYHAQTDGCDCRKPKPGMLLDAARELDIDLTASFMVGDRWSDIAAGAAAGCRTVFIDHGYGERQPDNQDFTARSLPEAVAYLRAQPLGDGVRRPRANNA